MALADLSADLYQEEATKRRSTPLRVRRQYGSGSGSLTLVRALYEFAMNHHGHQAFFSDSMIWLIGDAEARAEGALRRARERVRTAREAARD